MAVVLWVMATVVIGLALLAAQVRERAALRHCANLCRRVAREAIERDDDGAERGAEACYRAIESEMGEP